MKPAQAALERIRANAPELAASEAVRAAEVRLLRMLGKPDEADAKAEAGFRDFPESTWFAAEAGLARARRGDRTSIALLSRAENETPKEALYWVYGTLARINVNMVVEAGDRLPSSTEFQALYERFPADFAKLSPVVGAQLPRRLWARLIALIPAIDADRTAEKFNYDELARIIKRHAVTGGFDPRVNRLRFMVDLRRGDFVEALKNSADFLRKFGGLTTAIRIARDPLGDDRDLARGALRSYHELLVAAQAHPQDRYLLERYAGLDLPASTPHVDRVPPLVLKDGYAGPTTAVALTEPAEWAFSAAGDGVSRWRLPQLERDGFVVTPHPVCGLAASKTGDRVVFVTEKQRAYVWSPGAPSRVEPLTGVDDLTCLVAISADGRQIAAVDGHRRVHFWKGSATAKATEGPRLPWTAGDAKFISNSAIVFAPGSARNEFAHIEIKDQKLGNFRCGKGLDASATTIDGRSRRVAVATGPALRVCAAPSGEVLDTFNIRPDKDVQLNLYDQGRRVVFRRLPLRPVVYEVGAKNRRPDSAFGSGIVRNLEIADDGRIAVGWKHSGGTLAALVRRDAQRAKWEEETRAPAKKRQSQVTVDRNFKRLAVLWSAGRKRKGYVYDIGKGAPTCLFKRLNDRRWPLFAESGNLVQMIYRDYQSMALYNTDCDRLGNFHRAVVSPSGAWLAQRVRQEIEIRTVVEDKSKTRRFDCELSGFKAGGFSPDESMFVAADDRTICFIDQQGGHRNARAIQDSTPRNESGKRTAAADRFSSRRKTDGRDRRGRRRERVDPARPNPRHGARSALLAAKPPRPAPPSLVR